MRISQTILAAILDTGSKQIRRDFAGVQFTIVCTVEEGVACRFASSDWDDRTLAPLAARIADELGWRMIERAPRRQVVLRCAMPDAGIAAATCECDRGEGFQVVEVVEG